MQAFTLMKFIWFLALRYLKPRGTFFSIITLLSIIGVMLGVTVLIVVIGVMSGFERNIKQNILGLQAEIVLHDSYAGQPPLQDEAGNEVPPPPEFLDWRKCRTLVEKMPRIKSVSPYINLITLIEPDRPGPVEPSVANFLGLDPADPANATQIAKLQKMMVKEEDGGGTFDIGSGAGGDNIVINRKLAQTLHVGVGDKVNSFSPEMMKEVRGAWKRWEATKGQPDARKSAEDEMSKLLVPTEFTVAGLFDSSQHADFVILSLDSAQALSGKASSDFITGLATTTDDPFAADLILQNMLDNPALPPNWAGPSSHTWIDTNRNFFNAIQNERSMMFMVLMIIVVVAAFSTMISMIIFAVQKRREIGMIRALGATTPQVLGIFTVQGMIIGLVGVITGVTLGKTILHFRNPMRAWLSERLHIEIFPADVYGLSELPAYLRPEDVHVICLVSFALCTVAALVPAFFCSRGNPAKELRGGSQ